MQCRKISQNRTISSWLLYPWAAIQDFKKTFKFIIKLYLFQLRFRNILTILIIQGKTATAKVSQF